MRTIAKISSNFNDELFFTNVNYLFTFSCICKYFFLSL